MVVRELDPWVFRREGLGERLHDGKGSVASADPIDAGELVRCRSRRAAAGSCEESDDNNAEKVGQGIRG